MNPTLFSEIQRLFERTYAAVGINLEDCLIGPKRCGQLSRLAGASARERSEEYARNLELQAQVDTYLVLLLFVAFFRKAQRVSRTDRRWLRFHLFARHDPRAYSAPNLRGRYLETTRLARSYTRYLDTINGLRRLEEIRAFHALDYPAKKQRILALPAPAPRAGQTDGGEPVE